MGRPSKAFSMRGSWPACQFLSNSSHNRSIESSVDPVRPRAELAIAKCQTQKARDDPRVFYSQGVVFSSIVAAATCEDDSPSNVLPGPQTANAHSVADTD